MTFANLAAKKLAKKGELLDGGSPKFRMTRSEVRVRTRGEGKLRLFQNRLAGFGTSFAGPLPLAEGGGRGHRPEKPPGPSLNRRSGPGHGPPGGQLRLLVELIGHIHPQLAALENPHQGLS